MKVKLGVRFKENDNRNQQWIKNRNMHKIK